MFNPNQARQSAAASFNGSPQAQRPPAFGQQYQGMGGTMARPDPRRGPPQFGGGGMPPQYGGGGQRPPGSYDGVSTPSGPPPGYGYVWDGSRWVRPAPPKPGEYGGGANPGGG